LEWVSKPRPLFVVSEHLGDAIGPAGEELGRQPRLEGLDRATRLEPGDTLGERHAQHGRPRPLVRRLDGADGLHVRADPAFGDGAVQTPTMPPGPGVSRRPGPRSPFDAQRSKVAGTADERRM